MTLKHCNGCGENKELTDFYFHKTGKGMGKPLSKCKKCINNASLVWAKANPEKVKKITREHYYRYGGNPASENKSSSLYLGCVIAETILSREFPGFVRMPNNNPGYDYDCPRGSKIDVKSSCIYSNHWSFHVKYNKVPNYFLFLAFDNRENLNPEHIWLIPGDLVNEKTSLSITDSPRSLTKWSQYERPLGNVLECCSKLRGGGT